MILILLVITIIYLILIGSFVYGFDKIKPFYLEDIPSKTTFSIVIPFRNEADNLPLLLDSIRTLKYPKHLFEIIFIDDASEDNSVEIINAYRTGNPNLNSTLVPNKRFSNSPKKDAITKAIELAKYDWIVTTDADCILPKYWLESFDEYIQKHKVQCIVAPISYNVQPHFLDHFQLYSILSLQGVTIGGFGIQKPFLCNGANFAYRKTLFNELQGFRANNNIASGDDIFLLEQAVKGYKPYVHYLKCSKSVIITKPQMSWRTLVDQHIRWAAKTRSYTHWFGKMTGLIVLLMNAALISGLILGVLGLLNLKMLCYFLIMKFSIDFLLIFKAASFLNQNVRFLYYTLGFLVYPFFSVYIAFVSVFRGYTWKGRTYSK